MAPSCVGPGSPGHERRVVAPGVRAGPDLHRSKTVKTKPNDPSGAGLKKVAHIRAGPALQNHDSVSRVAWKRTIRNDPYRTDLIYPFVSGG